MNSSRATTRSAGGEKDTREVAMDSGWMIIAFAAVMMVIIWYLSTVNTRYYKAKQELAGKVNLSSRDHFVSFDGVAALAIDKKTRKILFMEQQGRKQKVVSFEDILSVELIEDQTKMGSGKIDFKRVTEMVHGMLHRTH